MTMIKDFADSGNTSHETKQAEAQALQRPTETQKHALRNDEVASLFKLSSEAKERAYGMTISGAGEIRKW